MRTVAIVQARLTSTRLPNKVLMDIAGKPMLAHVLERASAIPGVDAICTTIPDSGPTQALYEIASQFGYVTTGPEHDVLTRYVIAAEITNAERIVRVTADCPLLDPEVSGMVVAIHDGDPTIGYVSNVHPHRTWPDGLDTEVFTVKELTYVSHISALDGCREHVTTLMRRATSPNLESPMDLGRRKWSVDTEAELQFVRAVMGEVKGWRCADVIGAIGRLDLWDSQPESDDWRKSQ